MSDYQQRVKEELEQLTERTEKLEAFLSSTSKPLMSPTQLGLMVAQYHVMLSYKSILEERITLFEPTKTEDDV